MSMADEHATRRAGVRDVAQRAGVSTQTVSRVLNGYPHIREETRARVSEAIAALDVFRGFAEISRTELVVIDEHTTVRGFQQELRWNQAYYRLAQGL